VKKFVRIALLVAAWAAVTWLYRDKLLPLPRPESGPAPHFRSGRTAADRTLPPRAVSSAEPHPATAASAGDADPAPGPERASGDDLTEIVGIGPVYRNRLAGAGIVSFAELAKADPVTVAEAIDVTDSMVAGWIAQAREMDH
jgi:predicted flap endonuclease-1-like 5' DNA nuclease